MPTCSLCGAPCRDDALFCPNCGARFAAPDEMPEPIEETFDGEVEIVEDGLTEDVLVDEAIAQDAPEVVAEVVEEVADAIDEAKEEVTEVVEDAVEEAQEDIAEIAEEVQEVAEDVIEDIEEVVVEDAGEAVEADDSGAPEADAYNPYAGAYAHPTTPEEPKVEAPRPEPAVAHKVYTTAGGQAGGYQQAAYAASYRRYPAPNKVQYRDALRKGWEDFKAMPNWMVKILLLGLVSAVPILNFFAAGFAMRWGARAAFKDERTDMKIFQEGAFVLGFFEFVITLVWGIACSIVGIIPLVGVVAIVLAAPLMQLCVMRLALSRQLGDAFTFDRIWPTFKENFGSTMALFWLPNLITVAAGLVFSFVAAIVSGLFVAAVNTESALIIFALFGFILLFIGVYILCVLSVGVMLVVFRAFGYWIAEAQPDWVADARAIGADRID
ncbi:MAG: DUF4013 domain-containing protein [Eggerthellaceae bacterium]|nr:DUF4013 domain-containing protein [Eggerthellaceae bacterium]